MRWRGVDWIHSKISFTVQTRQHTRPHLISLGTRPMAPFPLGPIPRKTCWVLCSASLQGPESHVCASSISRLLPQGCSDARCIDNLSLGNSTAFEFLLVSAPSLSPK